MTNRILGACLSLILSVTPDAWAEDGSATTVQVMAGTEQVPIGIGPFAFGSSFPVDVSQVIENDLIRSGTFKALPRADLAAMVNVPSERLQRLRSGGVRFLVFGAVASSHVRFYLWDIARDIPALAYDLPVRQPDQLRYVAHQAADMIYQAVTGWSGTFNTKLAYVSAEGLGAARRYQLVVSDVDGERPRVIAASREPIMSPVWAPDRKHIAYVGFEKGRSSVYVQNIGDGQIRKLVSEPGINGSPAWSPDGAAVAVTLSREGSADIHIVDVATGKLRRLTDSPAIDTEPAWSPDGQTIAFVSDRGGAPRIHAIPAAGGEARLLVPANQSFKPAYSPAGGQLAYVSAEKGKYRIVVLDLASGAERPISDGPMDQSPSFSPNGRAVLFTAIASGRSEMRVFSGDGQIRQTFRLKGDLREPTWSPITPTPMPVPAPPRGLAESEL